MASSNQAPIINSKLSLTFGQVKVDANRYRSLTLITTFDSQFPATVPPSSGLNFNVCTLRLKSLLESDSASDHFPPVY